MQMRWSLDMSMVKVHSGVLPITTVDEMYELFARLGFPINNADGIIVISTKKGFIKKFEMKYNVKIYMVGSNVFVFGILTDEGFLEAFARLHPKGSEWYLECINKEYSHLCSSILDAIKRGIRLYETQKKGSSNTAHQIFKMSRAFESFLDGFAEVTAISAAIKYPIVERKIIKLGELGDVLELIDYLYSKYRNGKYVVLLLSGDWMFSIAVDLDRKEFTPSLVVWSSNLRLLGEEALKKFSQINRDENVRLTVYSMQE